MGQSNIFGGIRYFDHIKETRVIRVNLRQRSEKSGTFNGTKERFFWDTRYLDDTSHKRYTNHSSLPVTESEKSRQLFPLGFFSQFSHSRIRF